MFKIRRKSDGLFLNVTTYPWKPSFDAEGSSWRLPNHLRSAYMTGGLKTALMSTFKKVKGPFEDLEVVEFSVSIAEVGKTSFDTFLEQGKKK